MGGNVADYSVVLDGTFTIDVSGSDDRRFNISLPGSKVLTDQSSILSFTIRKAQDLRLRIDVNNRVVHEENIANGTFERVFQEVLPKNKLTRNGNTVLFTAMRGQGSFSDIVLWFQRKT